MCFNRYKGYSICCHPDPEGTPLLPVRCPDISPAEPDCFPRRWRCLHFNNGIACPTCSAQEPSVAAILDAYTGMIQELKDVGLSDERAMELWRFGEDGRHAADMERRRGPDNHFYEVLLAGFRSYQAEAKRLSLEMIDEQLWEEDDDDDDDDYYGDGDDDKDKGKGKEKEKEGQEQQQQQQQQQTQQQEQQKQQQ